MAAIHDLLKQVSDPALRARLETEVERLSKGKKFGLVFEEHLPEATPLYGLPIKVGSKVATKAQDGGALYIVLSINEGKAKCRGLNEEAEVEFELEELVPVALCGEPIYPYLEKVDEIENGGGELWHTLIQADNYHALQLLEYLYPGQVDCIYIDPPYNTGAKDWKYNNDYVDGNDAWRHSKWLSMMEKRLKIAKRLLNPKDSVLIVTIDEKEYLHLGMLLEQMFPETDGDKDKDYLGRCKIQMISSVINPSGSSRKGMFSRADEYIFFVFIGNASPQPLALGNEWSSSLAKVRGNESTPLVNTEPGWSSVMRRGSNSLRIDRPGMYYAIYANPKTHKIEKIGEPIPQGRDRDDEVDGLIQILPIRTNGEQGRWQVGHTELRNRMQQGRVRLGKQTDYGYVVNYLSEGEYQKIIDGTYKIEGYDEDGSIIARGSNITEKWIAPTQWKLSSHDASNVGAAIIALIFGSKVFSYPKSLYAVHDAIRFFVANKPNALILDFFAGSGTTLHAVNLLNAEDGGKRRCILVTNNEVSNDEAAAFRKKGLKPGDAEWEEKGIARYVTWPRTTCSIKGVNVKGEPLKGDYLGPGVLDEGALPGMNTSEKRSLKMSDGFKSNAAFFKLGFLDSTGVSLGRKFKELLPVMWMKAGAYGKCPNESAAEDMLVLPENRMAILFDECYFAAFKKAVKTAKDIETIYVVTDFEPTFKSITKAFPTKSVYALYRNYLDSFRLNAARN